MLDFRVCDDEYRGPENVVFIDVHEAESPIFGPFGPDPAATRFELTEP